MCRAIFHYCIFVGCRFKNFREVFDGYKHSVEQDKDWCNMVVNSVCQEDCGEIECRIFNKAGTATIRANLQLQSKATL